MAHEVAVAVGHERVRHAVVDAQRFAVHAHGSVGTVEHERARQRAVVMPGELDDAAQAAAVFDGVRVLLFEILVAIHRDEYGFAFGERGDANPPAEPRVCVCVGSFWFGDDGVKHERAHMGQIGNGRAGDGVRDDTPGQFEQVRRYGQQQHVPGAHRAWSQPAVTVLDPWQAQVVRPPCVPRVDAVQHHAFPVGQRRTVDDGAHRAFQQRLP